MAEWAKSLVSQHIGLEGVGSSPRRGDFFLLKFHLELFLSDKNDILMIHLLLF